MSLPGSAEARLRPALSEAGFDNRDGTEEANVSQQRSSGTLLDQTPALGASGPVRRQDGPGQEAHSGDQGCGEGLKRPGIVPPGLDFVATVLLSDLSRPFPPLPTRRVGNRLPSYNSPRHSQ